MVVVRGISALLSTGDGTAPLAGRSMSPASDARRIMRFEDLYHGVLESSAPAPSEELRSAKLGDILLGGLSERMLFRLNQVPELDFSLSLSFSFSLSFSLPLRRGLLGMEGDEESGGEDVRSPSSEAPDESRR